MFNGKNIDWQSKLVLSATYVSAFTAVASLIVKLFALYLTDSPTVLATFVDSLLDLIAAFINYVAALYASFPPDNKYRFGYGRAEDLAVFVQASLFGVSGIFILVQSVKRIVVPSFVTHEYIAIWLMCVPTLMTLALVIYQKYVVRKTGSNIVKCDSLHYSSDLITNIMVILALYVNKEFGIYIVDPIFAGIVGLYMMYGAVHLVRTTFNNLMDREFDSEEKDRLHQIILSHKGIKGYHDLKTRHAGRRSFIQFHLEIYGNISLKQAHQITEELEIRIRKEFDSADVIVHQDPEDVIEEKQFDD